MGGIPSAIMKTWSREARYHELLETLRSRLEADYVPGDVLPSERDLAGQLKASHLTVRKALEVLAQEGWIRRHHRQGTVVLSRMASGEIAIVVKPELFAAQYSMYYRSTTQALMEALHEAKAQWQSKLHLGRTTIDGEDYPATLDLLQKDTLGNLRGVFTFHRLFEVEDSLREKRVPVVGMGREVADHVVGFDTANATALLARHLRGRRCHKVAVLPIPEDYEENEDVMWACLARHGLTTDPAWRLPLPHELMTERVGYEMFLRLWASPRHPDALIVKDDVLGLGILRGILHLGVRVPEELHVATVTNEGIEFPFHMPLTRYEVSPKRQANAAVAMMLQLLRGEKPPQNEIALKGKLICGATT